jgi:hypothetical protein
MACRLRPVDRVQGNLMTVESRNGSPSLFDGSGVGFAQKGLHFCEGLFSRIEVRRIGRQEEDLGFGGADGGANGARPL